MLSRETVHQVMRAVGAASCRCPAHSQTYSGLPQKQCSTSKEYAIEMACSNIRYGAGVTQEVGMDFKNIGAKSILVVTDKNVAKLSPVSKALEALTKSGVNFDVYTETSIEPNNASLEKIIAYAKNGAYDGYLAVGGGSVMDTAKVANLYATHPDNEFLDFVNAPVGKGLPVTKPLKPLIAIPTTAGTGSETTGVAIFDHKPLKAKTGIGNRALRPLLGLVDPLHLKTMPERVAAFSAFDVFCHALESFTAIPYTERSPRPSDPQLRPAYQGSNPISDVWSRQTMVILKEYLLRSVKNPDDFEARSQLHLASTFAGIGFGNAGCHLCHGLSYPISGLTKTHVSQGYNEDKALVPHGLSVVITAPAVFEFTSSSCPERHLEAASLLGADITGKRNEDAGKVLADVIRKFMYDLQIENGLSELGYTSADVPDMVSGTLPQTRVTGLAPAGEPTADELHRLFENSMTVY